VVKSFIGSLFLVILHLWMQQLELWKSILS